MDVIGYQRWHSLLFLHFEVSADLLQPLLPDRLSVDTFEGKAYVSLTPFTVVGARLALLPRLPGLSTFHELNARTYVRLEDHDPGVWFFSLDTTNPLAAVIARLAVRLPYFYARVERNCAGTRHRYRCKRHTMGLSHPATFVASWETSTQVACAKSGSLEHFLTERYTLFSRAFKRKLWLGRVRHPKWPLQSVRNLRLLQSIDLGDGLPRLAGETLALYSRGVDVRFLPFHLV
jgi:uncharacterized protein